METTTITSSANTPTATPTKDQALRMLGVRSKRARKRVSPYVDLVHCLPGQRVMKQGSYATATFVCVTGSAVITDGDDTTCPVEGPFVAGEWASDGRRMTRYNLDLIGPASFLVIDSRARDFVARCIPQIERLSAATQQAVEMPELTPDNTVEIDAHADAYYTIAAHTAGLVFI